MIYTIKKLKKNVSGEKLKEFESLNKPEEREKFLLGLPDIISIHVESAVSIRDLEKALEFKDKGNEFFRQHNYGEAFKHHTQAVQHCPMNEENPEDPINRDYSIMLANMDGAGLYDA